MRKEKFEAFYEELCDTLIDDEFAHLQDGSLNLDEVKMYRFYKIKAMFESSQQNFTCFLRVNMSLPQLGHVRCLTGTFRSAWWYSSFVAACM